MPLNDEDLARAIADLLQQHTVMTLATADSDIPHAVSLMYAADGCDLYWLSDVKTRHSRHLGADAPAAVTIADQYSDFREIRGLQMVGTAGLANKASRVQGLNVLVARFPFLNAFTTGDLARHLGNASVYAFRPSKVTLIDNTRGFGFKQTWTPAWSPTGRKIREE